MVFTLSKLLTSLAVISFGVLAFSGVSSGSEDFSEVSQQMTTIKKENASARKTTRRIRLAPSILPECRQKVVLNYFIDIIVLMVWSTKV